MRRRFLAIIPLVALLAWTAPEASGAQPDLPEPASPVLPKPPVLPEPWSGTAGVQGEQDIPEPGYVENQLVVRFKPGVSAATKRELHARFGAQVIAEVPEHGTQLLKLYDEALVGASAYQARSEVVFAEPNYLATIFGAPAPGAPVIGDLPRGESPDYASDDYAPDIAPNDPHYPQQWHLAKIDAPRAWDFERGEGVVIAILDTGVSCAHPDLSGKCVSGYDYVNNDPNPHDDHGHGTHVAGIAAAATNNGLGVAGSGWDASIMPVKTLNATGNGSHFAIANGIDYAVDHGADVINMSLGGYFTSGTLSSAVSRALDAGVTIVAAAGNDAVSNPTYPAAYSGVIGVSATTQSDSRAGFSNYGSFVDVAAPGVGILSTVVTGGYQSWNGTSMATPIVAGVAALLLDQDGTRSPASVQGVLEATAVDLGTPGRDSQFGAGRIDAGEALAYGAGEVPTPGPGTPTATFPPPTPTATPASEWVGDVEDLINQERVAHGLAPLATDGRLRAAAARHTSDMAAGAFCSHNGSDGSTAYTRMRDAGYPEPYGEIVACGQVSPAAVVATWMNSSAHRAIILCARCTAFGAGHAASTSGYWNYWTVNFGTAPVSGPTPTAPPAPTATPTSTAAPPVGSPTPSPTPPDVPPDGEEIALSPANNRVGWVVSTRPDDNFFDDDDTFTGVYLDNRIYHGAMQFDLDAIPADAYVNYARLELTGRSTQFLGTSGTWAVRLLDDTIDAGFAGHGYSDIHTADVAATLLPLMGVRDLDENSVNTLTFTPSQVTLLEERLTGTGRISFRMDGPTGGSSMNLFTWDSGYGPDSRYPGPRLIVHYSMDPPTVEPSPTATTTSAPTEPPPPTAGPSPTATTPPTATATAPPPPVRTPTPTAIPTIQPEPPGLEIVPQQGDIGWVKEGESINHFGDDDMFTGFYHGYIYHGAMQFDLSSVPDDVSILSAQLHITGRDGRYLSRFGNGRWRVAMLERDIDTGWRNHGYNAIRRASTLLLLAPEMGQGDLDVGHTNTFQFADNQLWYLEERVATTGKVSFRLDGPRAGVSNVFSWSTGYGGGQPARLSLVLGPPGGDRPQPTQDPEDAQRLRDIVRRINVEREKAGVPPVVGAEELNRAARDHSIDMAMHNFFSHTGSDGSSPAERVERAGFRAAAVGELLAAANPDPDVVVDAWMARDQRTVLLDPRYTHVGAGYYFRNQTSYRHYWTVKLAQGTP